MTLTHDMHYTTVTPATPTAAHVHCIATTETARHALQTLFASLATSHSDGTRITAQQDMLALIRTRLLMHVARTYGYTILEMGESASHPAH